LQSKTSKLLFRVLQYIIDLFPGRNSSPDASTSIVFYSGILDKDARNSNGKSFGAVIVSASNDPVSVLLSQWMALGPYSLFECLNDVTRGMFWEAFLRALLCNTGKFDILVDCLKRFQNENGQGCVPQYVCIKLEEAARWSPLRLAWMQATATHG
jgi:hypothetical protein